jgi:hypothetical protein
VGQCWCSSDHLIVWSYWRFYIAITIGTTLSQLVLTLQAVILFSKFRCSSWNLWKHTKNPNMNSSLTTVCRQSNFTTQHAGKLINTAKQLGNREEDMSSVMGQTGEYFDFFHDCGEFLLLHQECTGGKMKQLECYQAVLLALIDNSYKNGVVS